MLIRRDTVEDYERVQAVAAKNPQKGSSALSSLVELPRSRIRSWLDAGLLQSAANSALERLDYFFERISVDNKMASFAEVDFFDFTGVERFRIYQQ